MGNQISSSISVTAFNDVIINNLVEPGWIKW